MEIKVETIPPEPVKPEILVHMTMSEEEAKILYMLAGAISGTGELRKITDKWYYDITNTLGIEYNTAVSYQNKYKLIHGAEIGV